MDGQTKYQKNRENILSYQKVWYENNKETKKAYYENNKDAKKEYYQNKKERIDCECGGKYFNVSKHMHLSTQKHQNYQQNLLLEYQIQRIKDNFELN